MSEDYSAMPSSRQEESDEEGQPYADAALPYMEVPSASPHKRPLSPPPQPEPFTEEARLAAAHRLGNVLKRYKNEPMELAAADFPLGELTGPMIMILIGVLMLGMLGRIPSLPLLLICLLLLTPLLGNVINRLPGDMMVSLKNTEFYLCTNGLMIIKWSRVQALHWEQIQAIRRNMTRDLLRYSFILYLDEGKPVTLDSTLVGPELKELGHVIEHEVSQRLLPDAIAAYEAGQALNFGSITVTTQGLTLEDEQQSLPWSRFAAIDYYNGYLLTIREKATTTWQKVEVASMLNLCVFLPLVTHIEECHRTNAYKQEQLHAQEAELEQMRRAHAEILERLRSWHTTPPMPEEVIEALRVLDLPSDASFDEIRHRYRQLAMRYHPDTGGDPETFMRIDAAYKRVIAWITSQDLETI